MLCNRHTQIPQASYSDGRHPTGPPGDVDGGGLRTGSGRNARARFAPPHECGVKSSERVFGASQARCSVLAVQRLRWAEMDQVCRPSRLIAHGGGHPRCLRGSHMYVPPPGDDVRADGFSG